MGTAGVVIPELPPRPEDAHKGSFGHVAVVGGSKGLSGAPVLAGLAALRIGAGLVTVAGPETVTSTAVAPFPELMSLPLPGAKGNVGSSAVKHLLTFLRERATVLAIGPGLGRAKETISFVHKILSETKLTAVADADALFALAMNPGILKKRGGPVVITPHPGEAAQLLNVSVADVQSDREAAVKNLAETTGCLVVLKGHHTLVADGKRVYTNLTGGPELAKGGSGDVLTGVIAGLIAQGMAPFDAAVLGAYLHGRAGELAAGVLGVHSVMARDVIDKLPLACRMHSVGIRGGA
jgi:NAD(P)H-hydrate epimerase